MAERKAKRRTARRKPELTVYYDGASRTCRAWIGAYRMEVEHQGVAIDWVDLSKSPDALDSYGIDPSETGRGLYAVDSEGTIHRGVDAVARLWKALPDRGGLAELCRTPPVRTVVRAARDHDRALKAFMRRARAGLRPGSDPGDDKAEA